MIPASSPRPETIEETAGQTVELLTSAPVSRHHTGEFLSLALSAVAGAMASPRPLRTGVDPGLAHPLVQHQGLAGVQPAALRAEIGAPLTPSESEQLEAALAPARQALGAAAQAAWDEGEAMSLQEAIECARSGRSPQCTGQQREVLNRPDPQWSGTGLK